MTVTDTLTVELTCIYRDANDDAYASEQEYSELLRNELIKLGSIPGLPVDDVQVKNLKHFVSEDK